MTLLDCARPFSHDCVRAVSRCNIPSSIDRVKQHKRAIVGHFAHSSNVTGLLQALTTLASIALLWWAAAVAAGISLWLTGASVVLLTLFTLRVFALMHECGHGSLFRSPRLNRATGFVLGVMSGMPQYVWSQHHNFHHAHNGDWDKYRGPYATRSVDEYAAMSGGRQRAYRIKCSLAAAPVAGFIYLIFMPRYTWIKGSIQLVVHLARCKLMRPERSLREHAAGFKTRYWKSSREYWHMFWNNVVLLGVWASMCWLSGTGLFIAVYIVSVSIAGGAGIVLFTVQHNFDHSYASDSQRWDYTAGAISGTSFLVLPAWLNWFTVNMGYHHIHHLSASIPNYRLAKCHDESQHLFQDVRRLKLSQIHDALKCILWDQRAQQIISVAEYRRQASERGVGRFQVG